MAGAKAQWQRGVEPGTTPRGRGFLSDGTDGVERLACGGTSTVSTKEGPRSPTGLAAGLTHPIKLNRAELTLAHLHGVGPPP